jgi:hypothetical protein
MSDTDDQEFIRVMNDAQARHDKWYADTMKKGSYVQKLTAQAARQAGDNAKNDGVRPVLDVSRRDFRYTVQQGLRAACTGREDTAAVFILMSTVLENQQTIKRLLWVCVACLIFIAIKVTGFAI